jgi:hypothetical protein
MSKLVRPRVAVERKQSLAKASDGAKTETRIMLTRLVGSREYAYLKQTAALIANQYRSMPGNTVEENVSYLTHCNILWAFNMMWRTVEDFAKVRNLPVERQKDADDGW